MSYWANRKFNELKNYAVNARSRCIENKENVPDATNSDSEASKATVKYLYMDPKFLDKNQANDDISRMQGGQYQQEVYYDCKEDVEEKVLGEITSNQRSLRMNDILNEIENPKEFKRALKQLVFNSNNLYRAFRQAYCKAKKYRKTPIHSSGRKCKYCLRCGGEKPCQQQKDRGDMIVNDKENVGLTQQNKPKNLNITNPNVQQEQFNSCNTLDVGSQCTTDRRSLENQLVKQTKRPEVETQTISTGISKEAQCLMETNANITSVREKVETSPSKNIQTEEPFKNDCQMPQSFTSSCRAVTTVDTVNQPLTIMSNTSPISLTIPLKLQIDPRGGKLRFFDSENKTETSFGKTKQNAVQQTNMPEPFALANKPKPESSPFCPCTTNSGNMGPTQATQVRQLEQNIDQQKIVEIKQQVAKSTQSSIIVPTKIPADPKPIQNNYVAIDGPTEVEKPQTTVSKPINIVDDDADDDADDVVVTDMPPTNTETSPKLEQLKVKAERLRAELLQEMLLTLAQSPPSAAIKSLQKDRRFSQPSDGTSSYSADIIRPVRFSLPANYLAEPIQPPEVIPLPVPAISGEKREVTSKLPPPPPPPPVKPTEPPVAVNLETSKSTTSPTGRINRNKKRYFIQEKFHDLLRPDLDQRAGKYNEEQRDEILFDLYKLFHPKEFDYLPKEVIRRNALYDVRLIVEPEPTTRRPTLTSSQESFLEDVRHILNPKSVRKDGSLGKKYRKEIKDKILEDLQIILNKDDTPADKERREQVLNDIRDLLDKGVARTTPMPTQVQASTSRIHRSKHKLATSEQQPISGSLIHDLIHKLDSSLHLDQNSTKNPPSSQR